MGGSTGEVVERMEAVMTRTPSDRVLARSRDQASGVVVVLTQQSGNDHGKRRRRSWESRAMFRLQVDK